MSVIEDRAGIQTSSLEVFSSRVPTEEARLPLESTLEECGFKGGPEESPPEATVYYDYRLPFTDCPILNYDHYIRSNQDSASNRGLWITKLFWGTYTYCRHQFCYLPEFQYNNNKGDFEQHPMSHIVEVRSKHTLIIHMNVVFFLGFQGSSFSWME